jgi:hypothetical protein
MLYVTSLAPRKFTDSGRSHQGLDFALRLLALSDFKQSSMPWIEIWRRASEDRTGYKTQLDANHITTEVTV